MKAAHFIWNILLIFGATTFVFLGSSTVTWTFQQYSFVHFVANGTPDPPPSQHPNFYDDKNTTTEHPFLNTQQREVSFDSRKFYPWKHDTTCKHFSIQLAPPNSLPKWALTSFPGSGVTWTRQMIEGLTGIYTGSVHTLDPPPYKDDSFDNMGNSMGSVDDPFCNCTIMDKDHEATETFFGIAHYLKQLQEQGYSNIINTTYNFRGVLLLRNPMDVVFTYRHCMLAGKVDNAPPEAFQGPEWDEVVKFVAYAWADHAIRWIEQIKNGTVIFYEKMHGDSALLELERLLDAMDFQPRPVDPERTRCTLQHRNRMDFKRTNKPWLPLDEKHRRMLMNSVQRVQLSLQRRKWPLLPIYLYDLHESSEN